ncbi:hypothetical protein [uncultured Erythrobacter sp.]|uniref:hypothetical protein n=1 Tax=uncultured Erythrobacter sp. TaxID=263913 RepID=UPI00262AC8CB|nr:hypothetical protein [uncultured Erythrobacter sp.]
MQPFVKASFAMAIMAFAQFLGNLDLDFHGAQLLRNFPLSDVAFPRNGHRWIN